MIRIKKIHFNYHPEQIRFDEYPIDTEHFLDFDQEKQEWKWKKRHKYLIGLLKSNQNEPYPLYVALNERNEVNRIKMEEVKLPAYLVNFYKQNQNDYDNYALAVEKFGHFRKDRLEYRHPNGKGLFYNKNFDKTLIDNIKGKQDKLIDDLKAHNKTVVPNQLTQTWRMATGLGNASAYNNGFTFHPVFGIPYIGGQQLKGIVRAYLIRKHFYEKNINKKDITGEKIEKEAMKDELFAYLFGREKVSKDETERKGNLHFLDAFPFPTYPNDEELKMEMKADIMNPHYGDYYSDKKAPGDYLSPNPIFFLSIVNASFEFCFWIDGRKNIKLENFDKSKLIEGLEKKQTISRFIKTILPEALEILGIGAKTAVGYGRFKQD